MRRCSSLQHQLSFQLSSQQQPVMWMSYFRCAAQTSLQRTTALGNVWETLSKNCTVEPGQATELMISHCCLKPLSFGVVCCAEINHWKSLWLDLVPSCWIYSKSLNLLIWHPIIWFLNSPIYIPVPHSSILHNWNHWTRSTTPPILHSKTKLSFCTS